MHVHFLPGTPAHAAPRGAWVPASRVRAARRADGARADAQASRWGDREAFWTWTICSTTSSPSFASASSATVEVCPVPTACRHTARTASLTLGLCTQEKWHLTSSTASITPFPLSSISCPRLRSCLRSRAQAPTSRARACTHKPLTDPDHMPTDLGATQ